MSFKWEVWKQWLTESNNLSVGWWTLPLTLLGANFKIMILSLELMFVQNEFHVKMIN